MPEAMRITHPILKKLLYGQQNQSIEEEEEEVDDDACKKEEENRNADVCYGDLLKKLTENPRDENNNKDLNRYLLYILSTKKTELTRKIFIEFYDNLATVFNYEVAEVFCYTFECPTTFIYIDF